MFVQRIVHARTYVLLHAGPKLQREVERRLAAVFGTTGNDRYAVPVPDALASLICPTLLNYVVDGKATVTKLLTPDAQQGRILAALKVSFPSR